MDADGGIAETYFKFRDMGRSEFEMEHVSRLEGARTGPEGGNDKSPTSAWSTHSEIRVESKVRIFLVSLLIDLLLVAYVSWIVNPFWIEKILSAKISSDSSQIPRRPLDQRLGCQGENFCWSYNPPTIRTPAGTFFPNFTSDSGLTVNYTGALVRALSIMANENCSEYRVVAPSGKSVSGAERTSPSFDVTRYSMQWAILMLTYECHPEISLVLSTPNLFGHWGQIDYKTLLPSPAPGPCVLNWTDLYNNPVARTRQTTKCSGRISYSDAASPDSGDSLVFQ